MRSSLVFALVSAAFAVSSASAEPLPQAAGRIQLQNTLRGSADNTPITTDPRVNGIRPPPKIIHARKPGDPDVIWPDHSQYGPIVQTLLACVWICILASLPFIIPFIDHQPVTRTQKIVGGAMLVVLFGGVFLFTNIILFNSVHFKGERPLTVVECIYFMSQVITTVGYGDIVPSKIRGQVFVGLYVIGALFIIAMLVSDVTNHLTRAAEKYRDSLVGSFTQGMMAQHECKHSPTHPERVSGRRTASVHDLIAPVRPSARPLLMSLAVFGALDILWISFFANFPGEDKTVFQATYMSVITLSTVGLGAFTPLTEEGMIFGAFMMLFGSAALVSAISNFCALVVQMNEWERFTSDSKKKAAEHLRDVVDGGRQVTQMQFFEWAVLNQKLMTEQQIEGVLRAFEDLKPENGNVPLAIIEESMGVEHLPSGRTPRSPKGN